MGDYADSESSSDQEGEMGVKSEVEVLGLDLPSGSACSKPIGGSLASSSQSHLKPYFVGMGFSSALVDKVLKENGEDDADLLLEALFTYSAIQKPTPESSDSLDGIFSDEEDGTSSAENATIDPKIEEFDEPYEVDRDKRASLLKMNFSVQEVDFAIDKLGEDAPVNELVDFIVAAQITKSSRRDINDRTYVDDGKDEEGIIIETLFGTMDKTLRLLEMGFSEDEISSAIDKYGAEIPVGELADSIFANRIANTCFEEDGNSSILHRTHHSHTEDGWTSLGSPTKERAKRHSSETLIPKTEASNSNGMPFLEDVDFKNILKGKRPKHEYEECSTFLGPYRPEGSTVESKPTTCSMPLPPRDHYFAEESLNRLKMPQQINPNPCRSLHQMLAKPPYFFYGNVLDVSHDIWSKLSQFLYAIAPEFVNTQFFSALSRKEGYIHNLPTDSRSHILPRSPMTIEDSMPHTKKWWPSWDNRKQLSCISSETKGISQLCERLGRILIDSQGMLSKEQQTDIIHHCKTLNLLWVGPYKLSPIEPEQLECMLGYPSQHTQVVGCDLTERLRSLKHCFQTDALGYHLSVLKLIFPHGLTVLSLYSGIGGAEIALHRLGLRLKGVVSVEASETNRRILKRWWHNTQQTGELLQIEDINRLTSKKLESLIKHFDGFDLVFCQNPCAYTSGTTKLALGGDNPAGLDFTLFYEFVRVLQRVRSTMKSR